MLRRHVIAKALLLGMYGQIPDLLISSLQAMSSCEYTVGRDYDATAPELATSSKIDKEGMVFHQRGFSSEDFTLTKSE